MVRLQQRSCCLAIVVITLSLVRITSFAASRLPVATVWGRNKSLFKRNRQSIQKRRISETTAGLRMTATTNGISTSKSRTISPPIAPREEDRVVYAGVAYDESSPMPRQAESSTEALLDPPVAIPDPYGWLRDESRTNETVLNHLKQENEYTEANTKHLEQLRSDLYEEMKSSIQETDYTVPRPRGEWWYYTRTYEGKSYTAYCRAPKTTDTLGDINWDGSAESPILPGEQVYLDVNALAQDRDYCSPGRVATSPSHKLLAYTVDFSGDETCELIVKNLETGKETNQNLQVYGQVVWGKDDSSLFYLKMDEAHRPFQVYRRTLDTQEDELLFEESDDLFWSYMYKSKDQKYLFIETSSKETTEIYFLNLENPSSKLQCIAKRRPKVLYDVSHRHGKWLIASNVGGTPNMQFFTCDAKANCQDDWTKVTLDDKPLFDGGYDRSLSSLTAFDKFVVASGREGGIPRVWIVGYNQEDDDGVSSFQRLEFPEAAHDVGIGAHYEFETEKVVVSYDSLVTPAQSLEISMANPSDRTVLKQRQVPGYDPNEYACDRVLVTARDGSTEIPVSLVYKKSTMEEHLKSNKPVATHLYGYGSYGSCCEADFRATRLPLLNRGVVYVIAHVRGGGEMGRQWYEEPNGAKYLCKKNTFNDFVDVAKWLIDDKKLTVPSQLSCEGRSAGGLLVGASINQAPELFKMALLGVPFVDVLCTMVDATIPLTAVEWEEWGNPNEKKFFDYMKEYSPVNAVKQGATYPSCLLTGGLHDPRVQYWEPTKFAAELRHCQGKDSGPVCVKLDMSAGHFSASDRYKYLKELAFDYAFLLDQLGLVDA